MSKKLFTERHGTAKARLAEGLDETTRQALLSLTRARIDEEWFGYAFPDKCGDGYAYAGTDLAKLKARIDGYGLLWVGPRYGHLISDDERDAESRVPSDGEVFDLLEFCFEFIAKPDEPSFHSYLGHNHYSYDQEQGRAQFTEDVNRLFERNGIALELRDGEVVRTLPGPLKQEVASVIFRTGDAVLDELLERARTKFLNREPVVRLEALEALWDAWERLKTVEAAKDKKASLKVLLDKAATDSTFRQHIEEDAIALTRIGNEFMIRHKETNKIPISSSAQADYLFERMFALIVLLLKSAKRL